MNTKPFCFYIIALFLLLARVPAAPAVTAEQLADICEAMESAIVDISLEYEWYNIPPWTLEETPPEIRMKVAIPKDGLRRFKLSAAGLLSNRDPNDPNSAFPNRLLLEESVTLINEHGDTWDSVIKGSYNGKIAKYIEIRAGRNPSGGISHKKRFILPMTLTPIGFSVLRLSMCKPMANVPLSAWLRDKEFVRLDNAIEKVNGFNTIRADLLQEQTKNVYLRIYFSVDHGYTPVRYEHMSGGKPGFEQVPLAFEVHSLEQVSEGLWFPSSGLISSADDKRADGFQVIGKILVNQGLTDEDFDIEFPPGTKVQDEIKGVKYVVKPK